MRKLWLKIVAVVLFTVYITAFGYVGCGKKGGGNSSSGSSGGGGKPAQVTSPNPTDTATNVITTTQLSWASASGAVSYDVYFGTSNPGTFIGNQAGTGYNPGTLSNSTPYYWRIDSVNANGTTIGVVWSFTTQAPVFPAQVTTPNPADGAINVPITQQLSWSNVYSATSYGVYFGTVSLDFKGYQAGTSYNPGGTLSYSTTYYWKIDSINANGTTQGVVWSFTTQVPPAQATLLTPDNAAITVPITTQLSWSSVDYATSYDVYFVPDMSGPLVFMGNQTGTTYNPGPLAYSTKYWWEIDSKNNAGTTTGYLWYFTTEDPPAVAPAQVTTPNPADSTTTIPITQQLSWASASGATSYDVYFGTTAPGISKGNQTGTSYNPGALNPNTTYYWRIDSKNTIGTTTGNIWSFTTQAPPAQVTTPNPADSATTIPITQQLSWASASSATYYDVYFGTDNPPSNIINGTSTLDTSYNPGTLSYSTPYYWRINSRNDAGVTTGIVWSFTTEAAPVIPPAQVTSPNPADGATDVPNTYQLSWAAASGATSYDVYFGTTLPGTPVTTTTGTTYNPGTLSNNTTYSWRIDSKNNDGTTTGPVWSFTTASTAVDDYVWVSNAGINNVLCIKKSDSTQTMIPVGTAHDGSAVDGTYCWVTNRASNNVTRIKKLDSTTTTIPVGTSPWGVAVDSIYVWVTNSGSNNVTRIKKSDLTTTPITVGSYPLGVAVDAIYVWVTNWNSGYGSTVTRIKKSDLTTTTINLGGGTPGTYGIAVDDTYVWVTLWNDGGIVRITKSNLTWGGINLGTTNPRGVAVDANYVWVTNFGSNNVTRIKKSDYTKTTITVGTGPSGVAVDATYCWVVNNTSSNITRILKADSTTTTITVGLGLYSLGDMTGYAYDNYAK
jgi:YVTN family beta-propeller protein